MRERFWQKNNPDIQKLLTEREVLMRSSGKHAVEEIRKLEMKIIQEDMISQIGWIAARTCANIKCKDCYLKPACKNKSVEQSCNLAVAIMKEQKRRESEKNGN